MWLAIRFKWYCFVISSLTARDEQRGKEAVKQLSGEGLTVSFHQLDIISLESIEKFRKFIQEQYGGIDVLVNNAAIAYKVCWCLLFSYSFQLEGWYRGFYLVF